MAIQFNLLLHLFERQAFGHFEEAADLTLEGLGQQCVAILRLIFVRVFDLQRVVVGFLPRNAGRVPLVDLGICFDFTSQEPAGLANNRSHSDWALGGPIGRFEAVLPLDGIGRVDGEVKDLLHRTIDNGANSKRIHWNFSFYRAGCPSRRGTDDGERMKEREVENGTTRRFRLGPFWSACWAAFPNLRMV
jgi:hypothetical protein